MMPRLHPWGRRSLVLKIRNHLPTLLQIGLVGAILFPLAFSSCESNAATFVPRKSDRPLEFLLPSTGTTMVAIPNDPIKTAVFDRARVDIQTDSQTGMLYILPKIEGSAMVYVTCRSGETAALYLTFEPDAKPRTIILEKQGEESPTAAVGVATPSRPLRAEGFSAEIKRFITLILRHETGDEAVRTSMTIPGPAAERAIQQLAPLNVRFEGIWRSRDAEAIELIVRNGTVRPIEIDPTALTSGDLWAVATTQTQLLPGMSTTLILVEAARE